MDLSTITVSDFKTRFYRDFLYKTVQEGGEPLQADPDYVQDQDIANAFTDAQALLNQALFSSDTQITSGYLYLTAHCLALNLVAADSGGINSTGTGAFPVASRSVGSVSESYQVPDAYKDDPILAQYAQTAYGQKYLAMVLPRLRGNMTIAFGGALPAR